MINLVMRLDEKYRMIEFSTLCRMMGGHPQYWVVRREENSCYVMVRCYDGKEMDHDIDFFNIDRDICGLLAGKKDWYNIRAHSSRCI